MSRYDVRPVADADCDRLAWETLATTNSAAEAKRIARKRSGGHAFGVGVLDKKTGLIDVGYGFGVPCPEEIE